MVTAKVNVNRSRGRIKGSSEDTKVLKDLLAEMKNIGGVMSKTQKLTQSGLMSFDSEGKITEFGVEKEKIEQLVRTGAPFVTCGCPDCNRPFYNEKPSGPIYNYPEGLTKEETTRIARKLGL